MTEIGLHASEYFKGVSKINTAKEVVLYVYYEDSEMRKG